MTDLTRESLAAALRKATKPSREFEVAFAQVSTPSGAVIEAWAERILAALPSEAAVQERVRSCAICGEEFDAPEDLNAIGLQESRPIRPWIHAFHAGRERAAQPAPDSEAMRLLRELTAFCELGTRDARGYCRWCGYNQPKAKQPHALSCAVGQARSFLSKSEARESGGEP